MSNNGGIPQENTDRELWREDDDYYAPSIHVTKEGNIGINVGGSVIVKPLREWHSLQADLAARDEVIEAAKKLMAFDAAEYDRAKEAGDYEDRSPLTMALLEALRRVKG